MNNNVESKYPSKLKVEGISSVMYPSYPGVTCLPIFAFVRPRPQCTEKDTTLILFITPMSKIWDPDSILMYPDILLQYDHVT